MNYVKLLSISYVINKFTYLCRFPICRKKHLKCVPSLWITCITDESGPAIFVRFMRNPSYTKLIPMLTIQAHYAQAPMYHILCS